MNKWISLNLYKKKRFLYLFFIISSVKHVWYIKKKIFISIFYNILYQACMIYNIIIIIILLNIYHRIKKKRYIFQNK